MSIRKRRKGLRLDDKVVANLPFKRKQYTVWDISAEGCGVRVSAATKACVISVRIGDRRPFETIGTIAPDTPYEALREAAIKRIADLKGTRLPKNPFPDDPTTLQQGMGAYIAAYPEMSMRTKSDYRQRFERDLKDAFHQPISALTREEILNVNRKYLQKLAERDPVFSPPRGFYSWQTTLRYFRAVITWYAAQKDRSDPWPSRKALPIKTPPARELPIELQTIEGRRRLSEGLKIIDTPAARANRFISNTGFRRTDAVIRTKHELLYGKVLEFKSKTRKMRIPLCRQALALIDRDSDTTLLKVTGNQLRTPLIQIFGKRKTERGGSKACVTPHDLRRLFKTVGLELGIDGRILNILMGHSLKGVDKHYIANLKMETLYAAAQRIADEIENPTLVPGEEEFFLLDTESAPQIGPISAPASKPGETGNQLNFAMDYLGRSDPTGRLVHSHYFTRQELYKLVWTAPMTEVAEKIGLSDRGLAKLCGRVAVPTPGRGYWAKILGGSHIMPPELPPVPKGLIEPIRIRGTQPPPQAQMPTAACAAETVIEQIPPPQPPVAANTASSACASHREWIESQVALGRDAMSIYLDLVENHGFTHKYNSVKRFVRSLKTSEVQGIPLPSLAPAHREVPFSRSS